MNSNKSNVTGHGQNVAENLEGRLTPVVDSENNPQAESNPTESSNEGPKSGGANPPATVAGPIAASPDPFDPAKYRLSQEFASLAGVKKLLTTVPVRRPHNQEWVRVRTGEEWRFQALILDLKDERESYLVSSSLFLDLGPQAHPVLLHVAINRQNVVFLWPARLPGEDGRQMEWHRSMLEAAELATKSWIRVQANMPLGAYEIFEAVGDLGEPNWPSENLHQLLAIAFRDRVIDSASHPILRRLRGEI